MTYSKFFSCENLDVFNTNLEAGVIDDLSLVFISSTKQIWTHGTLYNCPYSAEDIARLVGDSEDKLIEMIDALKAVATTSKDGLMSSADKTKLDSLEKITVDSSLSSTSTNPIQNKVVFTALEGKSDSDHTHNYAGSSSAGGAANSVKSSMTIKIKGGSTEGTSKYTFNGSADKSLDIKAGDNVTLTATSGSLTIASTDTTYSEATSTTSGLMSAADKTKLDNLSENLGEAMYESAMDDSLATVTALGGIPAGTTAATLKTKTLSEVFDDLLFPTIQPTVTAPSASLSLKSTSTTPTVQEVGTTGSSVPTTSSFNTSFSKGSININGVKKQDRSGSQTSSVLYYGSKGSTSNTTLPTTIPDGSINYYYRVNYAAGPTPLDSKGNTATSYSALAAGYVDSSAVTVYGVYPYYTNADSNSTFAKRSLTTSTTLSAVKFVAEGPNKHAFKLPAKYTLTKTELLNTLSGKYETFATSNWTVTTENITVQGTAVSYNVYTRNDSGFNGESTYNITFSK